jgi:ankyrin repeat protein
MLPDPEFAGPSSIGFEQVQFPWHAPDAYPFPATPQLSHSLDMRLEDITAMLSSSAEYTHGKAFKSGSVGSEEFRPLHQPSRSGDLTSDDWLRHRRLLSSDSITPPNGETPSSAVSLQYNPFTNAYISSEGSSATNSTTDLERLSVIQPSESSRISPRPNVPLLHVAIQTRKKSMVRLLLRRGACHVNERDPDGRTALHVAVQSGNQEIVEVLVKHGADPKAADRNGLDALRYAVEQGQEEIVEIMLDSIARGDQLSSVVEDYE